MSGRRARSDIAQPDGIIGRSSAMRQLRDAIARVATSHAPVLITGETGTGKDLVARAVHRASGCGPFVAVNCSAFPHELLESELFGHARGAFTGADYERIGLFEAADGGTLFLDEIAETPRALQAKLLRVLQSGEVRRVGDVVARHVSVRLLAASHVDLAAAVDAGRFREDLYYRINVLRLHVPPLRSHAADIPLLADAFLTEVASRDGTPFRSLSPGAVARLVAYPWPGNVRELRNVIEHAAIIADHAVIDVDALPEHIRDIALPRRIFERIGQDLTLADVRREHILEVLARAGGNRSRAAEILGVPRRTLYRRLDEYGIRNGHD